MSLLEVAGLSVRSNRTGAFENEFQNSAPCETPNVPRLFLDHAMTKKDQARRNDQSD